MPGPVLALTIGEVARRGFWAGPIIVLGHAIPEILIVIALTRGASGFLADNLVLGSVGLLGGTTLLGMGLVTVRKGRKATLQTAVSQPVSRSRTLVLSGALASVSNPYFFIWWATIGITYVLWSLRIGIPGVASFYSGHILGDLGWYALVSLIIASSRRIFSNTVYRVLLVACGIVLIALGGYFIVSGYKFLTG